MIRVVHEIVRAPIFAMTRTSALPPLPSTVGFDVCGDNLVLLRFQKTNAEKNIRRALRPITGLNGKALEAPSAARFDTDLFLAAS